MSTAGNADIVTQIQDHLNALVSSFFNFTGALQRDAPPVNVKGGTVARNANQIDVGEQTAFMAKQIATQSRILEELITKLPDLSLSEAQQLNAIAAAQLADEEEGIILGQQLSFAEKELSTVQDLFGILADSRLLKQNPSSEQVTESKNES